MSDYLTQRPYTPAIDCFQRHKPGASLRTSFGLAQHEYYVEQHGDDFERQVLAISKPLGERIESWNMSLGKMNAHYAAVVCGVRAALEAEIDA